MSDNYIEVRVGETINAGDEWYSKRQEKWVPIPETFIGTPNEGYTVIRRPKNTKTTIDTVLNALPEGDWVFIMRGLPGSGKSTAARKIFDRYGGFIASADNYWIVGGKYCFDKNKVPANHHWCLRQFVKEIREGTGAIVVDNTNTSLGEFQHYVKIAQAYGYKVAIITFECTLADSMKRNTHDVPEQTIKGMWNRMFDYQAAISNFAAAEKIPTFTIDTRDL